MRAKRGKPGAVEPELKAENFPLKPSLNGRLTNTHPGIFIRHARPLRLLENQVKKTRSQVMTRFRDWGNLGNVVFESIGA